MYAPLPSSSRFVSLFDVLLDREKVSTLNGSALRCSALSRWCLHEALRVLSLISALRSRETLGVIDVA